MGMKILTRKPSTLLIQKRTPAGILSIVGPIVGSAETLCSTRQGHGICVYMLLRVSG